MDRRKFIAGTAMTVAAIAIPCKASTPVLYGDGQHDDTRALQAFVNGEKVIYSDGTPARMADGLRAGTYSVMSVATLPSRNVSTCPSDVVIKGCTFEHSSIGR